LRSPRWAFDDQAQQQFSVGAFVLMRASRLAASRNSARSCSALSPALRITGIMISSPSNSSRLGSTSLIFHRRIGLSSISG
jgi:hypothetical protein